MPRTRSYWTPAKIIALVLVAVLVVSVSGFAAVTYLNNKPNSSGSSSVCTNGANNPPSCTSFSTCSNGATNPPTCTVFNPCSNGANNPPACTTFNPCINGATNPPACNNNYCSNGATNYPQCTIFTTATTIVCTSSTLMSHSLNSTSCDVRVNSSQAPTVALGSVGFSASGTTAWYANNSPCTLTLSAGFSYCSITGVTTAGPTGTMIINAEYAGDATHSSSQASFDLTVVPPPSTVTVTGTATTNSGCIGCSVNRLDFVDSTSSQTFTAFVASGAYSIVLANLHTYKVILYWSGTFGSGTCTSASSLDLVSSGTWYQNYFFANGQC